MSTDVTRLDIDQGLLFHRLRWRLFRNAWRTMMGQSLIRPLTILGCSVIIWMFVFGVSWEGFRFVAKQKLPLGGDIVGIVFDLMFLTLGVLLVFSTGLILYGSLFTAAETNFLLSKPVRDDKVFAYKFQGAVAFSSWAFLLLGGPVLIAYGMVCAAPWYFYGFLVAFFLGYVLLPGSVGAIICLLLVNFVPRRRKEMLAALTAGVVLVAGLWIWQTARSARRASWNREAVHQLLGRFTFARGVLLPNHWVATGLRAAGRGEVQEATKHLVYVWANGLFFYLLAGAVAVPLYRRGFNRLSTGGEGRRRWGGLWMDRLLNRLLPFVDPRTRLLIVKDFRTFRRDPQQWAQVLLLSVLMVLYVMNIRRMFVFDIGWIYQNFVSSLNLGATCLLMCTYTGRFVYPMLSLEGSKFWILGLLPLRRDQLLWGKFAFSTAGTLPVALVLVLISDLMLGMPILITVLHGLTVVVLAAGLSALSVGLGACMPNFRETDPSKIAVGFGGTLNLVVCLAFLVVILALMAGPWHVLMVAKEEPQLSGAGMVVVSIGAAMGMLIGIVGVFLPLHMGIQALRRVEF